MLTMHSVDETDNSRQQQAPHNQQGGDAGGASSGDDTAQTVMYTPLYPVFSNQAAAASADALPENYEDRSKTM